MFAGTSVGGLNSMMLSTFQKGKEKEAAEFLTEHYMSHKITFYKKI